MRGNGVDAAAVIADLPPPVGGRVSNHVDMSSRLYEVLQYPLLFERGMGGWQDPYIPGTVPPEQRAVYEGMLRPPRLGLADYTRCMLLQNRRLRYMPYLAQQWVLDMYSRLVRTRLNYFAMPHFQRHLLRFRTVARSGDVASRAESGGQGELGVLSRSPVYLPASFHGSAAHRRGLVEDGMAVVRSLGRPTFFITFTANPRWPEIEEYLRLVREEIGAGCGPLTAMAHTVATVLVFHQKLSVFIGHLRSGRYMRPLRSVQYLRYVIEFQGRGLPHAHILVRYRDVDVVGAAFVDAHVSARMPDVSGCRHGAEQCACSAHCLRRTVQQHMLHACRAGSCVAAPESASASAMREPPVVPVSAEDSFGDVAAAPAAPARSGEGVAPSGLRRQQPLPPPGGMCSKGYPKALSEVSGFDGAGRALYVRLLEEDQRVVPYNPLMLLDFDAHINVEVVAQQVVVRYLYGYLSKAAELANVRLAGVDPRDEITMYEQSRLVTSSEAMWRTFGFPINYNFPGVSRIHIHLPGRDLIPVTAEGEVIAGALRLSELRRYFVRPARYAALTLDAYYSECFVSPSVAGRRSGGRLDDGGAQVVQQVPNAPPLVAASHYVWPRHLPHVARVVGVGYRDVQLMALFELVHVVPARSFDDYLTFDGQLFGTFALAASARGLMPNRDEAHLAMTQAENAQHTPEVLRSLFVQVVCSFAQDPPALFGRFQACMLHLELPQNERLDELLTHLRLMFAAERRTLQEFRLPLPARAVERSGALLRPVVRIQLSPGAPLPPLHGTAEGQFSDEQRTACDAFLRAVSAVRAGEGGTCFFLDGPAGRGKTFLLRAFVAHCVVHNVGVVVTAYTGIAASQFPSGTTTHSAFGLGVQNAGDAPPSDSSSSLFSDSPRAVELRAADVVILDEMPMLHCNYLAVIQRTLRALYLNSDPRHLLPFAGKVVIGSGDFRQIYLLTSRLIIPLLSFDFPHGTRAGSKNCIMCWAPFFRTRPNSES